MQGHKPQFEAVAAAAEAVVVFGLPSEQPPAQTVFCALLLIVCYGPCH